VVADTKKRRNRHNCPLRLVLAGHTGEGEGEWRPVVLINRDPENRSGKKDASICGWARDLGRLSHPCFTIVSRMAPEKRLGFHAARMKPLKSFSV
jgi:hypothetical protein